MIVTAEDYRKLMLSSSRIDGESYPRPLYETNHEEWHKMFDTCYVSEHKHCENIIINIVRLFIIIELVLAIIFI